MQLLGVTEVVGMDDQPDALAALEARYPQYRNQPPQGPLLRHTPQRIIYWSASATQ